MSPMMCMVPDIMSVARSLCHWSSRREKSEEFDLGKSMSRHTQVISHVIKWVYL